MKDNIDEQELYERQRQEHLKKIKISKNLDMFLIVCLGLLQVIDFLFTWFGIKFNIIEESNPFMVWLFNLNFQQSLLFRLLFVFAIIMMMIYIRENSRKAFLITIIIGIGLNLVIAYMHYTWITPFLF